MQGVACDTLGNLLQDESNAQQFLELRGVDSVFQVTWRAFQKPYAAATF
jgi:hypothetical protein